MNGNDQKKVIAAGFVIIRRDDTPAPRIKYKDKETHEWRTLHKDFASKAARDRKMDELLKIQTIIED
jgi:hypothetical protein